MTPLRLVLPAGRYRIGLKGDESGPGELVMTTEVVAGQETPLHADLPGFDLESAVKSYAP
jgi:hypothetical protein